MYLLTDAPTQHGVWLAAVLALGQGAALCDDSATGLWQVLRTVPSRPHVTVAAHRVTKPPRAIRVHRSRTLREEDYDEVDGIPVTTLMRTLDDISRRVNAPTLKAALREGERRYHLDLGALFEYATSRKLRRMLETYLPGQGRTDSVAEAIFLEICARSTLPAPQMQRATTAGRVDFLFPTLGLIVEVDGYDAHRGLIAFRDDRTRDRRHKREGKDTLRFTYGDLVETPEEVILDLNAAHDRLCREDVDM